MRLVDIFILLGVVETLGIRVNIRGRGNYSVNPTVVKRKARKDSYPGVTTGAADRGSDARVLAWPSPVLRGSAGVRAPENGVTATLCSITLTLTDLKMPT